MKRIWFSGWLLFSTLVMILNISDVWAQRAQFRTYRVHFGEPSEDPKDQLDFELIVPTNKVDFPEQWQREAARAFFRQADGVLYVLAKLDLTDAPRSLFPPDADTIIKFTDLIKPSPTRDPRVGEPLSADELRDSKYKGQFTVVGPKGEKVLWQWDVWFIKGKERIVRAYYRQLRTGVWHLQVGIPDTLKSRTRPNFRQGGKNLWTGLRSFASLLIGLPETKAKYDPSALDLELENRAMNYSASSQGYLRYAQDFKGERFSTEVKGPLDMRLYDGDFMKAIQGHLDRIMAQADEQWTKDSDQWSEALVKTLRDQKLPEEQIAQALVTALSDEHQARYYKAILNDEELEHLQVKVDEGTNHERIIPAAGIGARLVDHMKALRITAEGEIGYQLQREEEFKRVLNQLYDSHPQDRDDPLWDRWFKREAETRMKDFYERTAWTTYQKIGEELVAAGLSEEARIFEAQFVYFRTREAGDRDELAEQRVPDRKFEWNRQIWFAKNWIREGEAGKYFARTRTTSEVPSDETGWRWKNFGYRTARVFKGGLYALWNDNLINGRLGVKALFAPQPYSDHKIMEPTTGEIGPVAPEQRKDSWLVRARGTFSQTAEDIALIRKGANEGHGGFAPGVRILATGFWGYLVKGVVWNGAKFVVRGGLTLTNAALTTAATALVTAWAPVSSLAVFGLNATTADLEAESGLERSYWHYLPNFGTMAIDGTVGWGTSAVLHLLRVPHADLIGAGVGATLLYLQMLKDRKVCPLGQALVNETGYGAAEVGVAAVKVGAYDAIWGLAWNWLLSPFRALGATIRDRIVLNTMVKQPWWVRLPTLGLLKPMTIPDSEYEKLFNFTVLRKVEGPGVSSNYYFTVSPDRVLIVLQAALEQEGLKLYRAKAEALIESAPKRYDDWIGIIRGNLGLVGDAHISFVYSPILKATTAATRQLNDALKNREQLYQKLNSIAGRDQIKLSETDLDQTLRVATVLCKNFYTKLLEGADENAVRLFWREKGVAEGDWVKLAQKELANVFGTGILVSFEKTDRASRVDIQDPSLVEVASTIVRNIDPEDLKRISLQPKIPETGQKVFEPARPLIGRGSLGKICRPLLITAAKVTEIRRALSSASSP